MLAVSAWSVEGAAAPMQPTAGAPAGGIAAARGLVRKGEFEAALTILGPLVAGETANANTLFLYGLAALEAAQRPGVEQARRGALLDEAIAAFRGMLVRDPGLVRVRLELGRAFFLKGEDTLARRHFERVLAGNPPAAVALNVNRFFALMRARKRWSVRLGMALAPDTNIGSGSDERIIYIHGLPFRRDQEDLKTSGVGISAWLGGEYQYPLGESGTGSGASLWRLRAGGDLSRREYRGSRFDRLNVAAHLGPRWLIGRASEASLLVSARHEWRGSGLEEPSHLDIGIRVEGRHRVGRRATLDARLSRYERRYDANPDLDGPITDVSFGASFVASPTLRLDGSMGWGCERTEIVRFRHSRRWLRAGATAVLPRGFTLGGSATLRWTDYKGNWFPFTLDGSARGDVTRSLRVFAHNRALTLQGFSPQVSVVSEVRTSNAQLHGYQRTSGELRFVRLF